MTSKVLKYLRGKGSVSSFFFSNLPTIKDIYLMGFRDSNTQTFRPTFSISSTLSNCCSLNSSTRTPLETTEKSGGMIILILAVK
jgi:hypothetical protein